jgi:hypothetical protein
VLLLSNNFPKPFEEGEQCCVTNQAFVGFGRGEPRGALDVSPSIMLIRFREVFYKVVLIAKVGHKLLMKL